MPTDAVSRSSPHLYEHEQLHEAKRNAAGELYDALLLVVQHCGPDAADGKIAHAALAKARGEHD